MTRLVLFSLLFHAGSVQAQFTDVTPPLPITLSPQQVSTMWPRLERLYQEMIAMSAIAAPYRGAADSVRCVPDREQDFDMVNDRVYRFCVSPVDSNLAGFVQVLWRSAALDDPHALTHTMYVYWRSDWGHASAPLSIKVFHATTDADERIVSEGPREPGDFSRELDILRDLETIVSLRKELSQQKAK